MESPMDLWLKASPIQVVELLNMVSNTQSHLFQMWEHMLPESEKLNTTESEWKSELARTWTENSTHGRNILQYIPKFTSKLLPLRSYAAQDIENGTPCKKRHPRSQVGKEKELCRTRGQRHIWLYSQRCLNQIQCTLCENTRIFHHDGCEYPKNHLNPSLGRWGSRDLNQQHSSRAADQYKQIQNQKRVERQVPEKSLVARNKTKLHQKNLYLGYKS